ncbi:MAG TPA: 3-deoxy-D-manno-octulosonate 8-phosphate phosphatase [Haliangiales bacterium]|nr:3-deoxy-D-manno-octulosonate 8-phosphate phosphatase [Haliangiales bacterium]
MLSAGESAARAARVRLVVTDSDGVLTDAGVYYSERGEELKRFSIRDGMGVQRLRDAGIDTAIVTGETSGSVARRGEKLGLRHVRLGVKDKAAEVDRLMTATGLGAAHLAYIGDDVNDLGAIELVGTAGLTGAPADALPAVREVVAFVCRARGGKGAFREFAEWILGLRLNDGGKHERT